MTKSYVVRGQGLRLVDEPWRVPSHVEIHFYRARRRAPQIHRPRSILDAMMVELGVFPDWFAEPGQVVPRYLCWAGAAFRRSSGALVLDFEGTSPLEPIEFSHIVRSLTHGRERRLTVIHWLVDTTDVGPRRALVQVDRVSNGK